MSDWENRWSPALGRLGGKLGDQQHCVFSGRKNEPAPIFRSNPDYGVAIKPRTSLGGGYAGVPRYANNQDAADGRTWWSPEEPRLPKVTTGLQAKACPKTALP